MGISFAHNATDGETLRRVNSFKKDSMESETPVIKNCGANVKTPVNVKGPRPESMINLERNLSFKSLIIEEEYGTKTFPDENLGAKTKSSVNIKGPKPKNMILERNLSFKSLVQVENRDDLAPNCPIRTKIRTTENLPTLSLPETKPFLSPRPVTELDIAAVKLQKVYKSYRTRRNLADCAVVVEELWWKALDFAALERSSKSFFNHEKPETAVSRWARARIKAAKVGKGLSKDDKAHILALRHWLEAIDPRHRYGHNLHLYYDIWFESESTQPFFFWLDIGDGKEVSLDKCPRSLLQRQCITYLGPNEREAYEVEVEGGKLVYRQSRKLVETEEGSKWIFVLSTTRTLYVGQKKKGLFQHSSFLCGAAITAAGRLVSHAGILQAIWPYSGHYLPTEENFREFICFLEENNVDLTNVKMCAIDDDIYVGEKDGKSDPTESEGGADVNVGPAMESEEQKRLSCKWTTGVGPRIGCVRDYPAELQTRALEQVNLSPRIASGPIESYGPIPSPRPCPKIRLSPRLTCMGLPSPKK